MSLINVAPSCGGGGHIGGGLLLQLQDDSGAKAGKAAEMFPAVRVSLPGVSMIKGREEKELSGTDGHFSDRSDSL